MSERYKSKISVVVVCKSPGANENDGAGGLGVSCMSNDNC